MTDSETPLNPNDGASPKTATKTPLQPGGDVLHDILLVFVSPSRVFTNLPRVNRMAAATVLLLILQGLAGWILSLQGVHDAKIDAATAHMVAHHLQAHAADEDPNQAIEMAETMEKAAVFSKLSGQLAMIIGGPLSTLVTIGCVGSLLFIVVALSGGKPKFAVLGGIPAFACFVELPRTALRIYLTIATGSTRVETSLAALFTKFDPNNLGGLFEYLLLRRLDPFEAWFWLLVAAGMRTACRFTFRRTILLTILFALLHAMMRMPVDLLDLADIQISMAE